MTDQNPALKWLAMRQLRHRNAATPSATEQSQVETDPFGSLQQLRSLRAQSPRVDSGPEPSLDYSQLHRLASVNSTDDAPLPTGSESTSTVAPEESPAENSKMDATATASTTSCDSTEADQEREEANRHEGAAIRGDDQMLSLRIPREPTSQYLVTEIKEDVPPVSADQTISETQESEASKAEDTGADVDWDANRSEPVKIAPPGTSAPRGSSLLRNWVTVGIAVLLMPLMVFVALRFFTPGELPVSEEEAAAERRSTDLEADLGIQPMAAETPGELDMQMDEITRTIDEGNLAAARELLEATQLRYANEPKLDRLATRLDNLAKREQQTQEEMNATLEGLRDRIDSLEDAARHRAMLDTITSAVGDAPLYQHQLEQYVNAYPDEVRSQNFRRVIADQLGSLEEVESWNELSARLVAGFETIQPGDAARWQETASSLADCLAGSGSGDQIRGVIDGLSAIAARGSHGELRQSLVSKLNNEAIRARYVYRWTNGDCYYHPESPERKVVGGRDGQPENTVFSAFCFVELPEPGASSTHGPTVGTKGRRFGVPNFERRHHDRSESIAQLDEILLTISNVKHEKWDGTFVQAIVAMVGMFAGLEAQERGEPVMSVYVLREILQTASRGSAHLAQAFEPCLQILNNVELDESGKWLDPLQPDSQRARIQSQNAIEELGALHAACIDRARQSPERPNIPHIQWSGWVLRNGDGKWRREPNSKLSFGTSLLFLWRNEGEQPLRIIESDPMMELPSGEDTDPRVEGMPVFTISR